VAAGTDTGSVETDDVPATDPPRRRTRRRRLALIVALAVTVGVGAGAVGLSGRGKPSAAANGGAQVQTVAVVKTDLSNTQTMSGTLGFGTAQTLTGAKQGIITALPAAGTTVTRGQQLYRVNDQPVPLFYGGTPLFRSLDRPGLVGRDVQVVASNLQALGYDVGPQPKVGTVITQPATDQASGGGAPSPNAGGGTAAPAPGSSGRPSGGASTTTSAGGTNASGGGPAAPTHATGTPSLPTRITVEPGDGVVTTSLLAAIKRWQTAVGLQPTGSLGVGDVVVLPGAIRIGSLQTQVGEQGAEALMSVTPTDKVVTVPVDPANIGSIKQGDKVTVSLPDNSTTPGTVSGIGTTVKGSAGGTSGAGAGVNGPPTVEVTVAIDDPTTVRNFDSATVQVAFVSATATGVLAVPVGALLALSGGGYAVQLRDGGLVAVQTGMFAKGMVAITGNGITAGTQVVTTT
jgi:hypothetical protein